MTEEITAPSGSVTVPKELFGWLIEYAMELRGAWSWKLNSTRRNCETMTKLDNHLKEAIAIRDEGLMNEPKFLDKPPDHSFEPTCEFKWIECSTGPFIVLDSGHAELQPHLVVLCQRFQGTFKDCWVRVPMSE